jgi:hypothetical protein
MHELLKRYRGPLILMGLAIASIIAAPMIFFPGICGNAGLGGDGEGPMYLVCALLVLGFVGMGSGCVWMTVAALRYRRQSKILDPSPNPA